MSLKHIMYQTVYLFFVHYGWEGSNDLRVIDVPTVVLTTYCVLSASYKSVSVLLLSSESCIYTL